MTFSLEIPPVEPSSMRFCKFIQTNFEVLVKAKVGGIHRSSCLRFPITCAIGIVPLSNTLSSFTPLNYERLTKKVLKEKV